MSAATAPDPVLSPVLPAKENVSTAYIWHQKPLQRLLDYVNARRPVWWRREPFHTPSFRDSVPKWHLFTGRIRGDEDSSVAKWQFTWIAACGYTRVREEVLFGLLPFKVGAPKKAERCAKCHLLYAAHLVERRQARAEG